LADEGFGLGAAAMARYDLKAEPKFILAGFSADRKDYDIVGTNQCIALVDLNVPALARKAVRVALDLADGRPTPERIEVPTPLAPASGPAAGMMMNPEKPPPGIGSSGPPQQ